MVGDGPSDQVEGADCSGLARIHFLHPVHGPLHLAVSVDRSVRNDGVLDLLEETLGLGHLCLRLARLLRIGDELLERSDVLQ